MSGTGSKQYTSTQVSNVSGKKVPARLCYVDDSRTSAYVVKRMLRPYGYAVDHFESAEPALVALVQDNYDLLLTDLKVSPKGMDGDDLVRALRNSGHDKISDLPVIVITGATDTDILAQVYDAGANHILTKPVNGDELDAEIRKLVFARKHTEGESTKHSDVIEPVGATVVPFGAEAKKQPASIDNIPVLNADKTMHSSSKNSTGKPSAATSSNKADERRVLGPGDSYKTGSSIVHEPVTANDHKPAPRVRPTVKVKTKSVTLNATANPIVNADVAAEISISKDTSSQLLQQQKVALARAKSAQAAAIAKKARLQAAKNAAAKSTIAKPAVKQAPGQQVTRQRVVQSRVAQQQKSAPKTAIDARDKAEALRKVKAAIAAKKAKLAEQQRAIEEQLQVSQSQASRPQGSRSNKRPDDILSKLSADDLSLEPLDNQPANVFQQPNDPFQQPPLRNSAHDNLAHHQQEAGLAGQQHSTASFGVEQNAHGNAAPFGHDSAATSFNQPFPAHDSHENKSSPQVEDVLAAFQQTGSSQPNILRSIEQYPLIETEYTSSYSPSRILRMVNSVLELYGPKRILTSVAMIGVILVVYGAWSGYVDDGMPVEVTSVSQGEIFQSITVPGRVVSKMRVNITPSIAGRITSVNVEEGDQVKTGDLLATLDDREAKSYLTRAKANLESAKEDVILAERSLKRLKQAFDKGAVARQLVEDAEVELRSANARESIAEEEVRTAKLSLENPRVVAPFSGTVTSRTIEVGQWVVPSETLFSLVDESQREIEVKVDAADSGGIAVGQTVNISSDAFPGLNWSESVTRLAAATNNVGNANTVSVYISLGNNAPSLRFGQQVDADIRTAWNPNALKVPYGAIVNKNGVPYVVTIDEGHAKYVQVETGIEDFSHVEILQGVNIGQTVVMANGLDIDNGQKVFLATNSR